MWYPILKKKNNNLNSLKKSLKAFYHDIHAMIPMSV